jgi:hypothetical protein
MEHRRQRASVGEVVSIHNEILAQLHRMDNVVISSAEMNTEIGKLRELHQVLVYRIEILRRINNGEM